jgi:hypothetical protein
MAAKFLRIYFCRSIPIRLSRARFCQFQILPRSELHWCYPFECRSEPPVRNATPTLCQPNAYSAPLLIREEDEALRRPSRGNRRPSQIGHSVPDEASPFYEPCIPVRIDIMSEILTRSRLSSSLKSTDARRSIQFDN